VADVLRPSVWEPSTVLGRACRRFQNGPADAPTGHNFGGAGEDVVTKFLGLKITSWRYNHIEIEIYNEIQSGYPHTAAIRAP
jgi:hypothetical protein